MEKFQSLSFNQMKNDFNGATLPDKSFACELASLNRNLVPFDNTEIKDLELRDLVLETTALQSVEWAPLFAYMHRRFGHPNMGGDDYKDLSASWMLTTNDPTVFVKVSPSLCGSIFSFGIYFDPNLKDGENINLAAFNLTEEKKSDIRNAYRSTLLDLLRPVCVRDVKINALGELGDSDFDTALKNVNEDTDQYDYEVQYHYSSGCPMPPGIFGDKEWKTLCNILNYMGDGDIVAGRKSILSRLQDEAFKEASKQSDQVKRLMMMSSFENQSILKQHLEFTDSELKLIDKEFRQFAKREPLDKSFLAKIELNMNDVDMAIHLLAKAGLKDGGLKNGITRFLSENRIGNVKKHLCKK